MTTIQQLTALIPGQTDAWYARIATEVDAGRMPMPCLEPIADPAPLNQFDWVGTDKPKPKPVVTPKPAVVTGKDYTAPILRAIGFGALTSYFVIFVSTSALTCVAIGSFFCADRLKADI